MDNNHPGLFYEGRYHVHYSTKGQSAGTYTYEDPKSPNRQTYDRPALMDFNTGNVAFLQDGYSFSKLGAYSDDEGLVLAYITGSG